MDVCVRIYCVFVLSCVLVAALRRADRLSKDFYRLCKKKKKKNETEEEAGAQERIVEPFINE
jgi:hypothetical protein